MVKNAPASAGDTGSILGQEHPLEKEMVTPSSILAWEIPWTEKPGALQSMRSQESDTMEHTQSAGLWCQWLCRRPPLGAGENWAPSWKAWTYTPPTPIYAWETLASLVAQMVKNLPVVQAKLS